MSKLILLVNKTVSPDKKTQDYSDDPQTIVVESDKFVVLPAEGGASSLILANGWQFHVAAEVSEIGTAMDATDATEYTT